MALRQTYLSLKNKLPRDAEVVLGMRGRGNDELTPSKELLEFPNSGDTILRIPVTQYSFLIP